MKLALLTNDNRAMFHQYDKDMPWFGTAPEALIQGFAQESDIEVHVVSCTQRPMTSPAKLADNIHFHSLHVPKIGWMRTGYQGCIRATRRLLRDLQPDIVHGQGAERDCAISAVLSGFPNVVTVHGKMTVIAELGQAKFGSFYWLAARLENFTLPRAGGIICISSYVENLVKRYQVPLWLIPNALQSMFFDFPRVSEKREIPLLINVGVISERKRQCQVLQVLCALRAAGLEFETIFVGSPGTGDPLCARFQEELAAAQAAHGGFTHIHRLGDEEFCRLFDTSSAMVHFSAEESFGLVFAEALARNLHLFASEVGSIRDIAKDVPGVEIFPLNDWKSLQQALHRWLLTDAFRQPKPPVSPEALVKRYHPAEVARQHLHVYREVLASARQESGTRDRTRVPPFLHRLHPLDDGNGVAVLADGHDGDCRVQVQRRRAAGPQHRRHRADVVRGEIAGVDGHAFVLVGRADEGGKERQGRARPLRGSSAPAAPAR